MIPSFNTSGPCIPDEHYMLPPERRLGPIQRLIEERKYFETEAKALNQMARYLDRAGRGEGWLVTFDLRKEVSWADKLFVREVDHAAKQIRIVGC